MKTLLFTLILALGLCGTTARLESNEHLEDSEPMVVVDIKFLDERLSAYESTMVASIVEMFSISSVEGRYRISNFEKDSTLYNGISEEFAANFSKKAKMKLFPIKIQSNGKLVTFSFVDVDLITGDGSDLPAPFYSNNYWHTVRLSPKEDDYSQVARDIAQKILEYCVSKK